MSAARTASTEPVRYAHQGPVAVVTTDRPDYHNAQNSAMTYALERDAHLPFAWVCDLIVAAEDAFSADPVVRMGIPDALGGVDVRATRRHSEGRPPYPQEAGA